MMYLLTILPPFKHQHWPVFISLHPRLACITENTSIHVSYSFQACTSHLLHELDLRLPLNWPFPSFPIRFIPWLKPFVKNALLFTLECSPSMPPCLPHFGHLPDLGTVNPHRFLSSSIHIPQVLAQQLQLCSKTLSVGSRQPTSHCMGHPASI